MDFLLQTLWNVLQARRDMLQIMGCGSFPSRYLQHSSGGMLQISSCMLQNTSYLQQIVRLMLRIIVILLQKNGDLQQNLRSGPSAIEPQTLSQQVGGLGILEMLQIDPVLQQDNRRMLQISRGRSDARATCAP